MHAATGAAADPSSRFRHSGGQPDVVGHQHYGAWQENNNFFQPPGHGYFAGDFSSNGMPHMAAAGSAKQNRHRHSASATKASKQKGKMRNRKMDPQMMHHPPMMMNTATAGFLPMPMMSGGPFDMLNATNFMHAPGATFATISDNNMTSATTQHNVSQYEESERKNKARIELLEKKIQAKDVLFEEALASTITGSCACGQGGAESKTLTSELKKRFLKLKSRYEEAEQEITRLTKTVKVVEIEVSADTGPLRKEIQEL